MKEIYETLSIDCEKCCGLCCVALYCMKTDGFPADKVAGKPCQNLLTDFRCAIHSELTEKKMKGCLAYDCFGAGQKVTQKIYEGKDWGVEPDCKEQMFEVFHSVVQLHQMLWYLVEASKVLTAETLQLEIGRLIRQNEEMTQLPPDRMISLDIERYREKVNAILKSTRIDTQKKVDYIGKNFKGANLDGKDLSMTLLIAANLEGCSLRGTHFLGADMRDANIRNADLSESLFLTQMQMNAAKGNHQTKLPAHLNYPLSW